MKYPIGILILIIGIYAIADLAIKTRYTRKRLKPSKKKKRINKVNWLFDKLIIKLSTNSKLTSIKDLMFWQHFV